MLDWIAAVATSAWEVLTFTGAPERSMDIPSFTVALGIAILAGISSLAGQGAVLAINRVSGLRTVLALVTGGVFLVALYLVQGAALAVVAPLITGTSPSLWTVASIALASTAPLVLAVLTFIPVLGYAVGTALQVWSLACLVALVVTAYQTSWPRAFLATAVAWFLMQVVSRLAGPAVARLAGAIMAAVTGRRQLFSSTDILTGGPIVPVGRKDPE